MPYERFVRRRNIKNLFGLGAAVVGLFAITGMIDFWWIVPVGILLFAMYVF